ncbi:hypothetical protein CO051_02865 [Candidatus Roizmanbacteria bacterium CG_4_9_14_0_2_um_filter_39_13]|uniref:Uncharacterized protein n=2 Tax=Candidatus Roizmaniibacteriota TaxID=1752723 RepID=A0A2M8F035_9BACT|nr:MAG: hypothetical protein COY15_01985 [Candidatus Roizmanbacteria bacterium CG_4_10_14_0_2_um_filter_39_12]PJC32645.1 MAG: hypothetical protein CO051_02865 [Candidatus Roizmanbacteria bacterium CG_4_9_14_0_2_um_filter_39_13]PJE61702.1 MAG: hypothetical protein COU87_03240 [Candidatus Roizmanbacteria bacterium CG10_big_fil_rev_8_21_14_0_10_39_12]
MFTKKQPKTKNLIQDSFEKVAELGIDTARQAVGEITKTFNPIVANFENPTRREREKGNQNFSDLDFNKLQKQYDHQDSSKLDAVRSQIGGEENTPNPKQQEYDYHHRVKREEEEYLAKKEQEEEEEKRQEAYEEQEKARLEQERQRSQSQSAPKGKIRKSILGGKGNQKSTTGLPPEFRPDSGKQ